MPHFFAQTAPIAFPLRAGAYTFWYEAASCRHPALHCVYATYRDYDFCLCKIRQKNGFLFKGEKSSRPTPVAILQNALALLAEFCTGVQHNLGAPKPLRHALLWQPRTWDAAVFPATFFWEIGFGSGRRLLQNAQNNPQNVYLGAEIHAPSLEQVLRQIFLRGLQNVRVVRSHAHILGAVLPSNRCLGIDVHFPVPWPKNPQRRVLNASFLQEAMRVLHPNAALHVRTDCAAVFHESCHLARAAGLRVDRKSVV